STGETAGIQARNRAARLLWLAALFAAAAIAGAAGFITGARVQGAALDSISYAVGGGALLVAVYAALIFAKVQKRTVTLMRALEARNEELSDRNWELGETEERARSLLESQGDMIVRRDSSGLITCANDAFCSLAGKSREALVGSMIELSVLERGAVTMQ